MHLHIHPGDPVANVRCAATLVHASRLTTAASAFFLLVFRLTAISPVIVLALRPERLCPLPRTRQILLVWCRSHSGRRREHHRDFHRKSAPVLVSLAFRLSPASQRSPPVRRQTHAPC